MGINAEYMGTGIEKVVDQSTVAVEKMSDTGAQAANYIAEAAKSTTESLGEMVGLSKTENKDEAEKSATEDKKETEPEEKSQKNTPEEKSEENIPKHKPEVIQMTGLPVNIEQSICHDQ